MKRPYTRLSTSLMCVELESGFLAGSKQEAFDENTEVTIDRQEGGTYIGFDKWE